MGYSIYVAARSKKDQERMFAFLEKNFRFMGDEKQSALWLTMDRYPGCRVKWPVGFDYKSWIRFDERAYVYAVVYWMSQVLTRPPHHYYYESEREKTPKEEDEEALYRFLSNPFYSSMPSQSLNMLGGKRPREVASFIAKERDRLKALWQEEENAGS